MIKKFDDFMMESKKYTAEEVRTALKNAFGDTMYSNADNILDLVVDSVNKEKDSGDLEIDADWTKAQVKKLMSELKKLK